MGVVEADKLRQNRISLEQRRLYLVYTERCSHPYCMDIRNLRRPRLPATLAITYPSHINHTCTVLVEAKSLGFISGPSVTMSRAA